MNDPLHPPQLPPPEQIPDLRIVSQELKGHKGFTIDLDASDALSIVSLLQLALRHPTYEGPSSEVGRSFIQAIMQIGFAHCPETQKLIQLGLEPAYDVTDAELDAIFSSEAS